MGEFGLKPRRFVRVCGGRFVYFRSKVDGLASGEARNSGAGKTHVTWLQHNSRLGISYERRMYSNKCLQYDYGIVMQFKAMLPCSINVLGDEA